MKKGTYTNKIKEFFYMIKSFLKDFFYSINVRISNMFPKKKKDWDHHNRAEKIFFYGMMALPLLQFAIFYVYVNFNSIMLAFKDYDVLTGKFVFNGMGNFKAVFESLTTDEGILYTAFKNSLINYALGLIVVTPLALFFSFYMYKKMMCSEFFRVVLFIPSVLSSIVLVSIFNILADKGFPFLMQAIKGGDMPIGLMSSPDTAFPMVLLYSIITGFGVNVLMYSSAMSKISVSVVESAELDGASLLREFFAICLPLIYPTLTTFLTVGVVDIFTSQLNLHAFFAGGAYTQNYTIGYYLFILVASKDENIANYPFAAATGLVFSCVAIPITLFLRYIFEKFGPQTEM